MNILIHAIVGYSIGMGCVLIAALVIHIREISERSKP